jgi:hypothetical protein
VRERQKQYRGIFHPWLAIDAHVRLKIFSQWARLCLPPRTRPCYDFSALFVKKGEARDSFKMSTGGEGGGGGGILGGAQS